MGQIRQIDGVYYIEFHARGLLYSQIAGNDLGGAQKLLKQVEEKIAGGEVLTIARRIELPDFYARFLAEAGIKYGPKSLKRFAAAIRHFSGFLKQDYPYLCWLDQLTPAIIESYKFCLAAAHAPKTVNLTVLLLRDILEFGITLGFINDNPALHARLLPWPVVYRRKPTARYQLAGQLLSKGTGLGKLSCLLKLPDIGRAVYFSPLIPLSRADI